MINVFVSYSRKDYSYFLDLQNRLRIATSKGILKLWSDSDIPIGEDFSSVIEKAITSCEIIIILLSPNYMKSQYSTSVELPLIKKQSLENNARLIAIQLSKTELPPQLADISLTAPFDCLAEGERNRILDDIVATIMPKKEDRSHITPFSISGDYFRDATSIASGATGGYNDINLSGAPNIFTQAEQQLGLEAENDNKE